MGLFTKLFGRKQAPTPFEEATTEVVCLHTSTAPQWDSPGDMGHEDRASRFVCAACGETFTPSQFEALRATEGERVRSVVGSTPGDDQAPS